MKTQLKRQEENETVGIWPENWDSVAVFMLSDTQWRTGAHGIRTGLDYTAVRSVMLITGVKRARRKREIFEDVRTMERAALKAIGEQVQQLKNELELKRQQR